MHHKFVIRLHNIFMDKVREEGKAAPQDGGCQIRYKLMQTFYRYGVHITRSWDLTTSR